MVFGGDDLTCSSVFIVCNLTNALFFWAFQPETKGLNLEDMNELFNDSPTFVPGSKWKPSSHVEEDAKEIAEHERGIGGKEPGTVEYLERVASKKAGL